jgi:hypothetical protein
MGTEACILGIHLPGFWEKQALGTVEARDCGWGGDTGSFSSGLHTLVKTHGIEKSEFTTHK